MKFKIRDGTLPDKNLCESCEFSQKIEYSHGVQKIICTFNNELIFLESRVAKCSTWVDSKAISLYELKKIAWIITPKRGGRAGFDSKPFSKLTEEEKEKVGEAIEK